MNVEINDLSTVKKKIIVKFTQEEVTPEIKKELINISKQAKIKGFRPGKAPLSLIEKLYTPEAQRKYADRVIKDSLLEIINNNNIDLAVRPIIEKELFTEDGFTYEASLEVHPNVDLKNYKGLEFKKKKIEVKEEEINKRIEELKNKHISFEELSENEEAKEDHTVSFDILKYKLAGNDLGTSVNQEIDLSRDTILKEIKEAILGLKKEDEKEFSFVYPEDIEDEKLRGKEVELKIKVKSIKKKVFPTDEELVAKTGKESIEALKSEITSNIIEAKQKDEEENFRKEVFNKIYDENSFEIPEGLKNEVAIEMLQGFVKNIEQAGLDPAKMGFEWDKIFETYKGQAEDFLKRQYIIKAIKIKENIEISEEELTSIIETMAEKSYNKEKMLEYFKNPEARKSVYMKEIEKRVFDFILQNNTVVEE